MKGCVIFDMHARMRAGALRTGVAIEPKLVEMHERRDDDLIAAALQKLLMDLDRVTILAHLEGADARSRGDRPSGLP